MDKVNYLSNLTSAQNGKYPITIEGLDFIQSQILSLQNLAFIGGGNYVIKEPVADPVQCGVIVWDGEVLPLAGIPADYVQIQSETVSINTNSGAYKDVREIRTAHYVALAADTPNTATVKRRTAFLPYMTNTELADQIMPVRRGKFTKADIDGQLTPVRLYCEWESELPYNALNGSIQSSCILDVYDSKDHVCQIVTATNSKVYRYVRYYRNGQWGAFEPYGTRDNFNIEAKILDGELYIRHSPLPSYCKLVLLRKKRRGKYAGRKNGKPRPIRRIKSGWFHSWQMELAKGEPERWYTPKCVAAIGLPLSYFNMGFVAMIKALMFRTKEGKWHILTVKKNWSHSQNGAFADMAIAVIDTYSHRHGIANSKMVRLRFRVWKLKSDQTDCCVSVK